MWIFEWRTIICPHTPTVHCLEFSRDHQGLQPHYLYPNHSKGILKNRNVMKETRNTDVVCINLVELAQLQWLQSCAKSKFWQCVSMQSQEAQLEHNQSHTEPLLIISLNICPIPPQGSEKRGTIWLMIQNRSPESLNTSASATLFHIVINSRNLSGCLTWICFNGNHLIPTKMLNTDVNGN